MSTRAADVPRGPALTADQCLERLLAAHETSNSVAKFGQYWFIRDERMLGAGACHAICIDWVRRKLFTNKTSFAVSKKGEGPTDPGERKEWMKTRLEKKGDRLAELQWKLSGFLGYTDPPDMTTVLGHVSEKGPDKYWVMDQTKVARIRDVTVLPPSSNPESGGRALFGAILEACLAPGAAELYHPKYRRPERAGTLDPGAPSLCYIVGIANGAGDGHALGFEVRRANGRTTIHFMDPNVGEFRYDLETEREKLLELGHYLWNFYRLKGKTYDRYHIDFIGT